MDQVLRDPLHSYEVVLGRAAHLARALLAGILEVTSVLGEVVDARDDCPIQALFTRAEGILLDVVDGDFYNDVPGFLECYLLADLVLWLSR